MSDVFFNDFSAQHGVLAVDMVQSTHLPLQDYCAIQIRLGNFAPLQLAHLSGAENMFLSKDVAISNLLQLTGNLFNFNDTLQSPKVMVSPDDGPPRPPR